MNLEQDQQFEARLREIRLFPVDPKIGRAITESLRLARRRKRAVRIRSVLLWGGLAVAASGLLSFGVLLFKDSLLSPESTREIARTPGKQDPVPGTVSDEFEPVLAVNDLTDRVDEGIVFLKNGLTARRYRYEFIDRVVWQNPSDGAIMEMEIPRDELVLVPVQTY